MAAQGKRKRPPAFLVHTEQNNQSKGDMSWQVNLKSSLKLYVGARHAKTPVTSKMD